MNPWIRNALLASSLVAVATLGPSAIAFASDAAHGEGAHDHHGRRGGLLAAALGIDSLTADQRAAIEKLLQGRRAAGAPGRAADAQLLTLLAQQVERAKIDPQGLAASLAVEQSASDAQAAAERGELAHLHAILTPAQRTQLVDRLLQAHRDHDGREAHEGGDRDHGLGEGHGGRWLGRALDLTPGQEAEIRANLQGDHGGAPGAHKGEHGRLLEAFRGDSFDPSAFVTAHNRGEGIEKLAAAAVPVLTPAQRATFAEQLRKRAAHETSAKGA